MSTQCIKCGKPLTVADAVFCPFCGADQRTAPPAEPVSQAVSPEAEKWLRQAEKASSIPARKKILLEARAVCPDCFPIEWELLFVGHGDKPHPRNQIDFSIIKSYLLEMYLTPEEFSEERKQMDRQELFGDPQLLRCLRMSGDPDRALQDYLLRLSREFIDLFLEGDNRISKTIMGFRLDRNPEKTLSRAAAGVLRNIQADEQLPDDRRRLLYQIFYQAFSIRLGGQTGWLDAEPPD